MGFIFKLDFLGREILGSQGGICKDTALSDVTPYIEPLTNYKMSYSKDSGTLDAKSCICIKSAGN